MSLCLSSTLNAYPDILHGRLWAAHYSLYIVIVLNWDLCPCYLNNNYPISILARAGLLNLRAYISKNSQERRATLSPYVLKTAAKDRMKYILLVLTLGSVGKLSAQSESVYLHLDKRVCYPGDTVWFRGSIFEDNYPSNLSTNLYVELYDGSDKLCSRKTFPIISSVSIGQVEIPRRSGLYWIRSYTKNSSFFIRSLTVRSHGPAVVIRKMLDEKELPAILDTGGLFFNTVTTAKGISCTIIPDSSSKYNDKPFKLLLKNYENNAGEYAFTLNKYRQRNILINKDSVRGWLSLFFYNADTLVARQDIFVPEKNRTPVELKKDKDGYVLEIKDGAGWNYSLDVVRDTTPSDPSDNILNCLAPPGVRRATDTSFLTYHATVSDGSARHSRVKNGALAVLFQNDTVKDTRLIPIDADGKISLSGLYFFDTTYMHYRLNEKAAGGKASDIQLALDAPTYPAFVAPYSTNYELDTLISGVAADFPNFDTVNYMTPAIVTPRWADRNKGLDTRYTTGRFSNPARFSFDLIHADLKYDFDVMDYLKKQLPGYCGGTFNDTPKYIGKPVVFYLNEQLMNWRAMPTNLQGMAYVKVFEDFIEDDRYTRMVSEIPLDSSMKCDHTPKAMVCVYTRKDEDFKYLHGQMNTFEVKGFDRPHKWNTADRTTLLWVPYIDKNSYSFNISHRDGRPFKIIVEGVNRSGEMLHFEQMVDQIDKYSNIVSNPLTETRKSLACTRPPFLKDLPFST